MTRETTLMALILQPQLGHVLIHFLPLEGVLYNLQLASQAVQGMVEDVLVEAYVQETIQLQSGMHRLHPMRPHYWNYGNVRPTQMTNKSQTLSITLLKLLKWAEEDAEKNGAKKGKDHDSVGSVDDPERSTLGQKLKAYLVESVLTPDLCRVGWAGNSTHPSCFVKSNSSGAPKSRLPALPAHVADLPHLPITMKALHQFWKTHNDSGIGGGAFAKLEVLSFPVSWFPVDIIGADGSLSPAHDSWVDAFVDILQSAPNLSKVRILASEGATIISIANCVRIIKALPPSLEHLDVHLYRLCKQDDAKCEKNAKEGGADDDVEQPLPTALEIVLGPLAAAVAGRSNLTHLVLPHPLRNGYSVLPVWSPVNRDALPVFEFFRNLQSCPNLVGLDFQNFYEPNNVDPWPTVGRVHKYLPQLTTLCTTACWQSESHETSLLEAYLTPEKCEHLTLLHSDCSKFFEQPKVVELLLARCPFAVAWRECMVNLKVTKVIGSRLTTLNCSAADNAELEGLLRECPILRALDLEFRQTKAGAVTDLIASAIASNCSQLRVLTISDNARSALGFSRVNEERCVAVKLTDDALYTLDACENLEFLDVKTMGFSVQAVLHCCRTQWPNLTKMEAGSILVDTPLLTTSKGRQFPENLEDCVPTLKLRPHLTTVALLTPASRGKKPPWLKEYFTALAAKGKHLEVSSVIFFPDGIQWQ